MKRPIICGHSLVRTEDRKIGGISDVTPLSVNIISHYFLLCLSNPSCIVLLGWMISSSLHHILNLTRDFPNLTWSRDPSKCRTPFRTPHSPFLPCCSHSRFPTLYLELCVRLVTPGPFGTELISFSFLF